MSAIQSKIMEKYFESYTSLLLLESCYSQSVSANSVFKFGAVDKKLCSNISSAGVRDKAQRQRKLLRVRERRMEFD